MDTVNLLGKPYLQLLIQTPFLSCLCWLIDNCRTSLTARLVNMSKMIILSLSFKRKLFVLLSHIIMITPGSRLISQVGFSGQVQKSKQGKNNIKRLKR